MALDRKTPRAKDDLIDWFTISYRTLYMIAGAVVLLASGGGYYYMMRVAPAATPPPSTVPPSTFGARFNSIEGRVEVRQAGTLEWKQADRSFLLTKSDLVRTFSGGSAEVRFTDGTIFHVRPDSLITIDESSENPASRARQVALTIQSGEANFQTPQRGVPGSATTISTPTVRTTAGDDAAGNIAVADTGQSELRVYRGVLGAETKSGQKIQLATNEGMRVDPTGNLGPKIALPGIPTLLAPPHQAEIAYVDPARSTTLLAWKAVSGAVAYHILLDFSPTFARPVVDRRDWRIASSMELRGLDVGTYYWKVAALDKDGMEGSFSDFARFVVMKPRANATQAGPRVELETLEARGNILQVKGKTEPGASLTVNGQRIDVASSGTFNEYITLEAGNKPVLVVVRATGINGGVTEQKHPVVTSY